MELGSSSYERKWSSLRDYIPFLRKLIDKLEGRKGSPAELSKVKSLHRVLTSPMTPDGLPATKLRMETLLKCEEILKALYEQVEGPRLESPKSPPPANRGYYNNSFHFQGHPSAFHHHRPPRIIPLERRSGGLEFTHQLKSGSPLNYGEYRRLHHHHQPQITPSPRLTQNQQAPLQRPSPPASPDPESTPASPDQTSRSEEEDLSDSESESLQIDEQLPPLKKEEEQEIVKVEKEDVEEIPVIASPDPEESSSISDIKEEEESSTTTTKVKQLNPELKPIFFASETEETVMEPEFSLKEAHLTSLKVDDFKSRREVWKNVYDKVVNQSQTNKRPARVRLKVTEVKDKRPLVYPDNDNLVLTECPELYSHKMSEIINKLKISVVPTEEESLESENDESNVSEDSISDLLPFIKDLKKDSSLSPYITDSYLKKVKAKDNLDYLLPLFKCWISPCQYATDVLEDFRVHLSQEKASVYHCIYCEKEFDIMDEFLDHVIYTHGRCPYQCPYCEFRSTSKISVLIHEQHIHPEQNKCYYTCKYLSEEGDALPKPEEISCSFCVSFSTHNVSTLITHVKQEHPDRINSIQFLCQYCQASFSKAIELLMHHTFQHNQSSFHVGILEVGGSDPMNEQEEAKKETVPLINLELLCGYESCKSPCQSLEALESHMRECGNDIQTGESATSIYCCFCETVFSNLESFFHHLRSHSKQLRISCALCSYRDLTSEHIIAHMKKVHGVNKTVILPRILNRKDKTSDPFVVVPEKVFKRHSMFNTQKNVYSPEQISDIPRMSMFKAPIHCSDCDFVTKVRMNFIKHIKLHKKAYQTCAITPINPPPCIDGRNFKSMGVVNEEEDRVLREDEIAALPPLIPENRRFACCSPGCNYITIDEVMLLYHIKTLHPSCTDFYICPHCSNSAEVDYEDLGFHIKCHGELLFKCVYCPYFHWQKRTAQQHVIDLHKDIRGSIRDVRKDTDTRKAMTSLKVTSNTDTQAQNVLEGEALPPKMQYLPYHCGLCDTKFESNESVKQHIGYVHALKKQFHCHLCDFSSDDRNSFKDHISTGHLNGSAIAIQAYYVKQSERDVNKQSHAPLWSRHMLRVRHIRGILFDDEKNNKVTTVAPTTMLDPPGHKETSSLDLSSTSTNTSNPYKAKCTKCGVIKKSIKNLKTHIQAVHLKSTKTSCSYCAYTALTIKSVKIHHKKCHPDMIFETNVKVLETATFDHEYWKSNWKIPKPNERKRLGYEISPHHTVKSKLSSPFRCKLCEYACNSLRGLKAHNTKNHPHSGKLEIPSDSTEVIELDDSDDENDDDDDDNSSGGGTMRTHRSQSHLLSLNKTKELPAHSSLNVQCSGENASDGTFKNIGNRSSPKKSKDLITAVLEISPFEHVPTFKCLYCPKRTQSLIRIERHLSSDHPNQTSGHRMLTRDQVVEMITNSRNAQDSLDYSCYLCDKGGDIIELKDHFLKHHPDQTLKVKKRMRSSGYLECRICGYLTPGFDRSQQKAHHHDEHPLEENTVAHKYVLKRRPGPSEIASGDAQDKKFDFNKFAGESVHCPRDNCDFESKSISAIMAHLRKHTQTFKCGHCGGVFNQSSAFNNHSALVHGDKIPDLVKDMEAEAELEGLKALLETSLSKSS